MIDYIRKACELSSSILKECIDNFSKFKTEKDVADWLRKKTKEKNIKLAFLPLVVSGKNFLEIHHKPNNTELSGFTILDFGVRYNGYSGDVTRMIYKGKPSEKDFKIYDLILRLHRTAIREVKIGMNCSELDMMIRDGYGKDRKKFKHSLGHGVGGRIHQPPWIKPSSKYKFKENDVVTIEPGWYSKNKGIRIEDTILLTKNKKEILTKLNYELKILN